MHNEEKAPCQEDGILDRIGERGNWTKDAAKVQGSRVSYHHLPYWDTRVRLSTSRPGSEC